MNIKIDPKIKKLTPEFSMAVLTANVEVHPSDLISDLVLETEQQIEEKYDISDCIQIPRIKCARDAYKIYGKDPSRYRLAVESLYRRLSKGNKLYRINALVDLGNVLSIETMQSVAVLDLDKISGDILVRLGTDTDHYEGIGRGKLNITNIPLYEDAIGPFGSTTSDTERTMITSNTTTVLLFIISFSGVTHLKEDIERAERLLKKYASATDITKTIIT